jgi:hypothetical protein
MKRSSRPTGGPDKLRKRAAKTRKRHVAASPASGLSAAKAEVARLVAELGEARERQAATAEVLRLIADAPTSQEFSRQA